MSNTSSHAAKFCIFTNLSRSSNYVHAELTVVELIVVHYSVVFGLLVLRPSFPKERQQNNNYYHSDDSAIIDIIVWLSAKVEASKAVYDASQNDGRASVEMQLPVRG